MMMEAVFCLISSQHKVVIVSTISFALFCFLRNVNIFVLHDWEFPMEKLETLNIG